VSANDADIYPSEDGWVIEIKLTFFNDPGHGWLRAPKKLLKQYGVADKISEYSYADAEYAYLEEDCDAPRLLDAIEASGLTVKLIDRYSTHCFVRRLGGYNPNE
jgi:hypothetical protein